MSNFSDLINSGKPVLVDFSAEWCGPCKSMVPILQQAKAELGDKATIIKVDVDKNESVAANFQVRAVPTLIMFKNGKEVWKKAGVVPVQELLQVFKQYI